MLSAKIQNPRPSHSPGTAERKIDNEPESSSAFDRLPDYVGLEILRFVADTGALRLAATVSHKWRLLASDNHVWRDRVASRLQASLRPPNPAMMQQLAAPAGVPPLDRFKNLMGGAQQRATAFAQAPHTAEEWLGFLATDEAVLIERLNLSKCQNPEHLTASLRAILSTCPKARVVLPVAASPGVFGALGQEYYDRGRLEDACWAWRQQATKDPLSSIAQRNLCAVFRLLGRNELARKAGFRATILGPTDALAHFNYACILHRLGDINSALAHLDEAIDIWPHSTLFKEERARLTPPAVAPHPSPLADDRKAQSVYKSSPLPGPSFISRHACTRSGWLMNLRLRYRSR